VYINTLMNDDFSQILYK